MRCWLKNWNSCRTYCDEELPYTPGWFFNYEEAKAFLVTMAHRNNVRIVRLVPVPLVEESVFWKALAKRLIKRLIAPTGDSHLNLSTQAVWVVLEKQA